MVQPRVPIAELHGDGIYNTSRKDFSVQIVATTTTIMSRKTSLYVSDILSKGK